jgi:hypothetical protein
VDGTSAEGTGCIFTAILILPPVATEGSAVPFDYVPDKDKVVEEEPDDQELLPHRLFPFLAHLPPKVRVFENLYRPLYETIGIIRVDQASGNPVLDLEQDTPDIGCNNRFFLPEHFGNGQPEPLF